MHQGNLDIIDGDLRRRSNYGEEKEANRRASDILIYINNFALKFCSHWYIPSNPLNLFSHSGNITAWHHRKIAATGATPAKTRRYLWS